MRSSADVIVGMNEYGELIGIPRKVVGKDPDIQNVQTSESEEQSLARRMNHLLTQFLLADDPLEIERNYQAITTLRTEMIQKGYGNSISPEVLERFPLLR